MIEATGAQIVVKLLERQGIRVVAGIPGGSTLPLYDELGKSSLKHILVRHEQAAGFLAQGMSRTTGIPAVCLATSGPGAMNLLTAVADARSDSIPMVAITGQVNRYLIGTDAFQEVDTFGLSFPITKHSVMVKSARELLTIIPEAFALAASGRPGPVLIDIPRDVQLERVVFDDWPAPGVPSAGAERYGTDWKNRATLLAETIRLLKAARHPVLYAGGGCNNPEAARAVAECARQWGLPVAVSLMGVGVLPHDHPAFMGMVGMHGCPAANQALYEADLVLACGVRFDDRATGVVKQFCPNAMIVHIDIDAAEINKILPSRIQIVAGAAEALSELNTLSVKESPGSIDSGWLERLGDLRRSSVDTAVPGRFIASLPDKAASAGLNPQDILITTDVGQHQMWAAQSYPVSGPRTFLTSGSLGTMGFGLPTALGAAVANPGKRVVCISGDGSIMMNIQELATLAEEKLDVTVIVLDNNTLGMVRQQQHFLFNDNYSGSLYGKSPDLVAIAAAFGIRSVDASEDGWETAAFATAGPCFVRFTIDRDENVYPFVPAGKANIDAITGP